MKDIRAIAAGSPWAGRRRLFAGGLLLAAWLGAPAGAHAVTFTRTLAMPGYSTGTTMTTQSNPTLGTFDFSGVSFGDYNSITSISLTLALYDLQTMSTGSGNDRRDYNNISLTLGGASTGILLNNYPRNAGATVTNGGAPTNGAAILAALTANGGMLTLGLLDATASPSNAFDYFGGIASLTLEVTAVPFGPSTTLGFSVIAAIALLRAWPRWKRRFALRQG